MNGMNMRIALGLIIISFCGGCGGDATSNSGSDGGKGSCSAYVVPGGTDLSMPLVSFHDDIMKLFNNSCGASTCHGTKTLPMGGLFLGQESAMRSDAAEVWAGLVGPRSQELPTMAYVTPGDPSMSYLMHKLDGDQCQFDAQCGTGSCGDVMPQDNDQALPVGNRDTVRRWIAQGARNN
jgi:hypothetical protein